MSKKLRVNVTHNLTLQFATKNSVVPEEVDNASTDVNSIRCNLPTKTSATRQISDLESIPAGGPFLLNFSNIPYEATEADLRTFFRAFEIINVVKSEQKRGTGIIEFKDFNGLAGALNMTEKVFINRQIRLTIGTKEDQARIQSSGNQRTRYQNQQRSSSFNDDNDNWRTKKSQPISLNSASDNFSQNKEKSNWRDKPITRSIDEKPSISCSADSSENWRRTKTSQPKDRIISPPTSMIAIHENTMSTDRGEVRETEVKKVSIFGEAKPVDTTAKDIAIEKKINLMKTDDIIKSDSERPLKTGSWAKKPVTTTPVSTSVHSTVGGDKSVLEWREKVPKTSIAAPPQPEAVTKVEVVPAPIPTTNIWHERLKRNKEASSAPSSSNVNIEPIKSLGGVSSLPIDERNLSGDQKSTSSSSVTVPISNIISSPTAQLDSKETTQIVVETSTATVASITPAHQSQQPDRVPQKPPVVISVNGPFIDPRSRTPHHSISETSSAAPGSCITGGARAPVAVPVVSSPAISGISRSPCTAESTHVYSNTVVPPKSCAATSQNPWAKGPPKSLLDKTEIHQ